MKPIGPYVAVRELPGSSSGVRTVRGTDRLTGMPVLLHVLTRAPRLPELPEHPHLLRPVDAGMDGDLAYLVSELPLQAQPATDPELAARGALKALAALHARGLVHGGVSRSQLWSVDGQVLLAGAGLPWGEGTATPEADLRDLAAALEGMGPTLTALRDWTRDPGSLRADEVLALLDPAAAPAKAEGARAPALRKDSAAPEATLPSPSVPVAAAPAKAPSAPVVLAPEKPAQEKPVEPKPVQADAVQPDSLPSDAAPSNPAQADLTQPVQSTQPVATQPPAQTDSASAVAKTAPTTAEAAPPTPAHDGTVIVLGEPDSTPPTAPPAPAPSSPAPGTPETPQERRKRQNEERRAQAMLDAKAAAERKAKRLAEAARAAQEGESLKAAPIQIGFGDAGGDLPPVPTEGVAVDGPARPTLHMRDVPRLPASLRREPEPEPAPPPVDVGHIPSRRMSGEPIRIGWDEDDSWRVVRTVEAPPPRRLAPVWLLPAVLLPLLVAGVWSARRQDAAVPPPPAQTTCCEVAFEVRGVPGVTARLSVERAPQGSSLKAGAELGVAPGRIRFPEAGTYRLRVMADGYDPATVDVSVPRSGPFQIELGD